MSDCRHPSGNGAEVNKGTSLADKALPAAGFLKCRRGTGISGRKCHICGESASEDGMYRCERCGKLVCDFCIARCGTCNNMVCKACRTTCSECQTKGCPVCTPPCQDCGNATCRNCMANLSGPWLCRRCTAAGEERHKLVEKARQIVLNVVASLPEEARSFVAETVDIVIWPKSRRP